MPEGRFTDLALALVSSSLDDDELDPGLLLAAIELPRPERAILLGNLVGLAASMASALAGVHGQDPGDYVRDLFVDEPEAFG